LRRELYIDNQYDTIIGSGLKVGEPHSDLAQQGQYVGSKILVIFVKSPEGTK